MAELAEQLTYTRYQETVVPPPVQLAEAVPGRAEDLLVRRRAARFIGACLLGDEAAVDPVEANLNVQPIESLHDAIQKAAKGNEMARKMVETNVRTDVIERTIKAGHVISVDLQVDEAGKIRQYGQSMESVQANSLRYAAASRQMLERTEAEATNAFRIEQYHRQGTLEEYSFVVFSPAADNMSQAEMQDAGFFTDTMSCAIQVTSANGGRLTTESAFVAGVRNPGAARHDIDTIADIAGELEIPLPDLSSTGILGTPWLVHNSLIQNGAVDLVAMFDARNGTFFGQDRPTEDYLAYLEKCREREATLQPKIDDIVAELIREAAHIHNPLQATKRLNKLSGKHMIEQAVFDNEINPRVFGAVSAAHIEEARRQFASGDANLAFEHLSLAKTYDKSSSCPAALKAAMAGIDGGDSQEDQKESDADCEYVSKKCPMCGEKNVKTTVKSIGGGRKMISGKGQTCRCSVIA